MATPVKMPRLGESVAEGTLGAWLKQEGDYVEKDESLAEIVTDKINAELPSPVAGRLSKILVNADETVPVGVDIALIEESSDVTSEPEPDTAPMNSPTQAATPVLEEHLTNAANGGREHDGRRVKTLRVDEEERQRISPLAKRLAREHGVDLSTIGGTGGGGRVRKEDILAYVEQQRAAAPTVQTAAPVATPTTPSPQPAYTAPAPAPLETVAGADEELVTPSRMRLSIAEHMVRSKHTSPHATTVVEVDMTNIAFVMKAVCEGIRRFPLMNSSWTSDNKIIVKKRINLGVAVSTDAGLLVPTIYDADQFTLAGLARQVNALAQRARSNKLTIQDMQNSTFVVNNPGVFGTIISVPIINQPHAGILSMDAVVKRPVVIEDDAIAVRSMMYLCLSFDHRIMDGAGAAGFLQAVRTRLQGYGREIDVY